MSHPHSRRVPPPPLPPRIIRVTTRDGLQIALNAEDIPEFHSLDADCLLPAKSRIVFYETSILVRESLSEICAAMGLEVVNDS